MSVSHNKISDVEFPTDNIHWDKNFEICPLVDHQHKNLISLLAKLQKDYNQNLPQTEILHTITELKNIQFTTSLQKKKCSCSAIK